jgi:hypothetical protein
MADKTIKVKVDVETNVEPSIAALKSLKKELKTTAAGSEDFKQLQQSIDDMEDSIKSARTGAGNFSEVLGQLPGPIGDIGSKVSGAVNSLKQFGGLKFTDLKASFVELGRDLTDAAKGLGELTGITKVYTVLNGFLAKSFTAVGIAEGAAAVGAKALSAALIATGIGALVVLLATAVSALYELATGQEAAKMAAENFNRALDSQNQLLDLNAKSSSNRNKVLIAQMKAQGKSEKEIRDTQLNQAYKDYQAAHQAEIEAVEFYNKNLGKTDAEGFKKMQENLDKRQAATKDSYSSYLELGYNNKATELKEEQSKNKELAGKSKAFSDKKIAEKKRELDELKRLRDAELAEITKGEEEAFKATLGERERTEYEINEKYAALIASATKYNKDTTILESGLQAELKTMRDKFTEEDLVKKQAADDKKKELDEKEGERLKKKAEDERGILLTGLQAQFEALDRENKQSDLDFEQDLVRFQEQKDILAEQEITELQNTELTEFQKTEIRKKYSDARIAITNQEVATEKAAAQAKHEINMAYLGLFQQFGGLLSQVAGKNKALAIAGIVISQAASIGQIIASTAVANAKSVAALPLTFGQPWVTINTISAALSIASTVASAAKSISQINSAASGAGIGGGGGGSAGSSATMPTPPTATGAAAPTINTSGGQSANSQLAETIGAASGKPVKAYVVSGDVSSQQALDRRTNRAATFSTSTGG